MSEEQKTNLQNRINDVIDALTLDKSARGITGLVTVVFTADGKALVITYATVDQLEKATRAVLEFAVLDHAEKYIIKTILQEVIH